MFTKKERNHTIDFLRGLAVISIILIHTAWWSGMYYLPTKFSSLFLLFDVPIFMFIAGLSYSYVNSIWKNIKGILKQWNKWIYFLIFYLLIIFIFFNKDFNIHYILNYIFYDFPNKTSPLIVVQGSIWFIPMYIKVTILCSIILYFYNNYKDKIDLKIIIILMLLMSQINFLFIDQQIGMYSVLFLLGYYASSNKIESFKALAIYEVLLGLIMILLFKLGGYSLIDLQKLKFPPSIYYISASLPGIVLFWYLKDKLKIKENNPINYIGKNALFFYYSQGISSSLLILIQPYIKLGNPYFKFILMAIINITLAIIIGVILNELYNLIIKTYNKYKKQS